MFFASWLIVAAAICYFTVKAANDFGGSKQILEKAARNISEVIRGVDCGK